LEGAFTILCPFAEIRKRPGASRKPKAPGVESLPLRNAFAGLSVEKPSDLLDHEEPQTAADVKEAERMPRIAHGTVERDEAELEAEFYCAIECFLEETQAIRSMLKDTWDVYRRTGYDLVIATLLTNTAIDEWPNDLPQFHG
jgi:hypothetical protein